MMHKVTLLTILLTALSASTQDVKTITVRFAQSQQIAEQYSVLKKDGTTRHGNYVSYFKAAETEVAQLLKDNSKQQYFIRQKGEYANGKKQGEWIEYSRPAQLLSEGNYTNGKKTGIWITWKENHQVMEKFDYDKNQSVETIVDFANIFVHYPEKSRDLDIDGTVTISYQTDSNCILRNLSVTNSVSPDCDTSGINALKSYLALRNKYGLYCKTEQRIQDVTFKLWGKNENELLPENTNWNKLPKKKR